MAQAKVVVYVSAFPGQADELDRWYEERHIPDLLAVPGLTRAERFSLTKMMAPPGSPEWDLMAVYTLEGDDIAAIVADMGGRMGTERMPKSPALDSSKTLAYIASPK